MLEFERGAVLAKTGAPISSVYFPHTGIISLVVELRVGEIVETAMVGRDGAVNAVSALDGKVSLNKAIVQMEGIDSVISADHLSKADIRYKRGYVRIVDAVGLQKAACECYQVVKGHYDRLLK